VAQSAQGDELELHQRDLGGARVDRRDRAGLAEQQGEHVAAGAADGEDIVARADVEPAFEQEVVLPHLGVPDHVEFC
jgi:hypothetical protein